MVDYIRWHIALSAVNIQFPTLISVLITTYFLRFIMENVYFWCTLPLGRSLITLMEINSHGKNACLTYSRNTLAAFLAKERKSVLNIRGRSFIRTILVKIDHVKKGIINRKDSKATNTSWKNVAGFFWDREQTNLPWVVSS